MHLIRLLLPYLPSNTALGLLNDPTFAGKSRTIHRFLDTLPSLKSQASAESDSYSGPQRRQPPELRFVIGTDTLTRFFAPRYYTSTPGGLDAAMQTFFEDEGCVLISARRGDKQEREVEEELVRDPRVAGLVERGKVVLVETEHEKWANISSTDVRRAVKADDWARVGELVVPEVAQYIRQEGLYRTER